MEQQSKASLLNDKVIDLTKKITSLGKEVAESRSTTQFPEWIHFKIGISIIEGVPYDNEFWSKRMEPGVSDSNEHAERNSKQISEQEIRKCLLDLQLEREQNVVKAQAIVLKHLEKDIETGESATVAAMAEILKI